MCYFIKVFFSIKLVLFHVNPLLKLVINFFLGPLVFVLEALLRSIYTILPNRSYYVFDHSWDVPTKLKHYVICKYVNFALVSVCQFVNVVRSVFCHPHVSFLAKPLFTTVNLVRPVTVYNVKSVNSAHRIGRVFPSMHFTTSTHRQFSYRRHTNVTSFPLPSSNLLSFPGIKSHLLSLTSKLNLSPRPSSPPGTSSPPNFQRVSSSIKIYLFLITLFNAILLNKTTQHILLFTILTDIILFFLVCLKFCSNMSGRCTYPLHKGT